MQFALFCTGLLWAVAARAAAERAGNGLTVRFQFDAAKPLLTEVFFLFLLLAGFTGLHWIATRTGNIRETNALPERPTAGREWLLGAALGWGLLLVCVLPMILFGDFHPQFWWAPRSWGLAALSLAAVAAETLAIEAAFRGYIYKRLIEAVRPLTATILLSLVYAVLSSYRPNATTLSFVISFVAALLFSLAYLRTHALWLGWGLHFAWSAAMGILFGLPVRGAATYSSLVLTTTSGADWFTGGAFGPDGALLSLIGLLAGMAVLYQATRDYAWSYTHPPIVPAAYAVTIAPPAAHTAMEQAASAAPASLVQIAPATPMNPSTMTAIEEHLRENAPTRQS